MLTATDKKDLDCKKKKKTKIKKIIKKNKVNKNEIKIKRTKIKWFSDGTFVFSQSCVWFDFVFTATLHFGSDMSYSTLVSVSALCCKKNSNMNLFAFQSLAPLQTFYYFSVYILIANISRYYYVIQMNIDVFIVIFEFYGQIIKKMHIGL